MFRILNSCSLRRSYRLVSWIVIFHICMEQDGDDQLNNHRNPIFAPQGFEARTYRELNWFRNLAYRNWWKRVNCLPLCRKNCSQNNTMLFEQRGSGPILKKLYGTIYIFFSSFGILPLCSNRITPSTKYLEELTVNMLDSLIQDSIRDWSAPLHYNLWTV